MKRGPSVGEEKPGSCAPVVLFLLAAFLVISCRPAAAALNVASFGYQASNNPADAAANTAAFNAAIAALPITGGTITVPHGVGYWNGLASPDRPVRIKGEGMFEDGGTLLISHYNGVLMPFTNIASVRSTIEDISFNGPPDESGVNVGSQIGLVMGNGRVRLRNVMFNKMGRHAIFITWCIGADMYSVEIQNTGDSAVVYQQDPERSITTVVWYNPIINGNKGHAFEFRRADEGGSIHGGIIESNGGFGFVLENVPDLWVTGVHSESNAGDVYFSPAAVRNKVRFTSFMNVVYDFGQGNSVGLNR